MNLYRRIGQAVFSNTFIAPLAALFSFVGSVFVARYLSLETYGIYVIVLAIKSTSLLYSDLGMSAGASRFFPELEKKEGYIGVLRWLKGVFVTRLTLAAFSMLIIIAFREKLSSIYGLSDQHSYLFVLVGILIFTDSCTLTIQSYLRANLEQKAINLVDLAFSIIKSSLIILSVILGYGLKGLLIALVVSSALNAFFFSVLLYSRLRYVEKKLPQKSDKAENLFKRFIKLSLSVFFIKQTSYFTSLSFIILVMGLYFNKQEIAFFSLAAGFANKAYNMTLMPTKGVLLPSFSFSILTGDRSKIQLSFTYSLKFVSFLIFPVSMFLICLCPILIPMIYTEKFLPSVILLRIILFFSLFASLTYSISSELLIAGEHLRVYVFVMLLSILFVPIFFLVSQVGLVAIATFYGFVQLSVAVALTILVIKLFNLKFPTQHFIKMASATITVGLVLLGIKYVLDDNIIIIILSFISLLAFLPLLRLLNIFSDQDKDVIRKLGIPFNEHVVKYF